MQQYLPLAVLKRFIYCHLLQRCYVGVATVLTACGIETLKDTIKYCKYHKVATVLTACGIETFSSNSLHSSTTTLQQYLPLAVLKQLKFHHLLDNDERKLQQYLPLAVLKLAALHATFVVLVLLVATVLTACGIET